MAKEAISQGFTGTQKGLNYVGNHAYAYSGAILTSAGTSADTTCLLFTTGSEYIHVDYLGFEDTETNVNRTRYMDIYLNGERILVGLWKNAQEMSQDQPVRLIIPPYTQFELKVGGADGGSNWSIILTGKVYR